MDVGIGVLLATLRLFRESDGSVRITIANADGAMDELQIRQSGKLFDYTNSLIVEAAKHISVMPEYLEVASTGDVLERAINIAKNNPFIPQQNDRLPPDVVRLVIAVRKSMDDELSDIDDFDELEKAVEAFSSRVPYENEPEDESNNALSDEGLRMPEDKA